MSYLAIGHFGSPRIRVYDTRDWTIAALDSPLVDTGWGVAFSPDGSLLAVAHTRNSYLPELKVYNTSDWTTVPGTPALAYSGRDIAFSPNGLLLAVGLLGLYGLTVINTSNWTVIPEAPFPLSNVWGVDFSPDGSLLAVAYRSSPFLRVYNTSDWAVVPGTPTLTGEGRGVHFSPDGSLLAVANISSPRLTVINTSDWTVVPGTPTLAGEGTDVAFSPNGSWLAATSTGFTEPYVVIINTADWTVSVSMTETEGIKRAYGVDFSPDGSLLAVAHEPTGSNIADPRFSIFHTADWTRVAGLTNLPGSSYGVGFSPPIGGGISGTVYEINDAGVYVPGAYPVHLYNRATGVLAASTMSLENGVYGFAGVTVDEYYVMAIDHTSPLQRSAIVDKVVPS